MKKMVNSTIIEGYLYEHNLEQKVTGEKSKNPNTPYLTGTISIATDNAITNIVQVHYTYVTATTSTGKVNRSFNILNDICTGKLKSVMSDGADAAAKVRVESAFGLNEFYSDRNGNTELVSVMRNEGGFISLIKEMNPDESKRNIFKVDMVITKAIRQEENEERGLAEREIVSGAIFNYSGAVLPVNTFIALNPAAMDYFDGLDASPKHPVFMNLWGRQISENIKKTIVTENAFGEQLVEEVPSSRRLIEIIGGNAELEWDTEEAITAEELTKAMANRNSYLAEMKSAYLERKANMSATPAASNSDFDF